MSVASSLCVVKEKVYFKNLIIIGGGEHNRIRILRPK